jgi:anaerobic magnesium-protoporphyrin IX monomethyl ester cyclase
VLWFKFTEMVLQCRPPEIRRVYFQRDARLRHAMRWYTRKGRRVWPMKFLDFLHDRLVKRGPTVAEFWGAPQDSEEESMSATSPRVARRRATQPGPRPSLSGSRGIIY